MALLPFKKLTLIAHSADEEKILTLLSRTGSAEIIRTSEIEHCVKGDASSRTEKISSEMAELSFCFDFWRAEKVKLDKVLRRQKSENVSLTSYAPKKIPLLEKIRAGKPDVAFDEFDKVGEDHEDILAVQKRLREISAEETELRGEATRNASLIEQLSFYEKCDLPFDAFKADRLVETAIGLAPTDVLATADLSDVPALCLKELDSRQRVSTLFVAYPAAEKETMQEKLSALSFSKCSFTFPVTAAEKIAELRARGEEIYRKEIALAEEAVSYEDAIALRMRVLYDYYRVESEKARAIDSTFRSTTSFVLTAWVPAHMEEGTEKALQESGAVYYSLYEDPLPDEKYPTLAKNNAVVTPYESITNMYSAPDPREIDPNPFVAFFYFVLFGLMVSDAAYGLILALGGFGLYFLKKPKKGEGQLLLIIGMGGISTLIWGVMFGGYFGESFIKPVMFNPMNEPLKMLILSVALGLFQILFGMGISFVQKCKNKKPLSAVFGEGSWFILFIGLGLFVLSGMVKGAAAVKLPALIVLGIGILCVLIGGAMGKKGVKGKLIGAFGNVYNVTGFMSDILSYCRLFGLGLATGVVGMVVNLIAGILRDLIPVVGYLLFVVILVVGHVFNIAINTLGAYVHNSRLQYVEFFSRFYTGGGHIFKPMGSDLKYIHLNSKGGKDL
ncbi:MAG TPA: hypothetical protein DCG79_01990 [Clostridiales bacterium]|nr:hypothetical protein [Clostridiales bacterium]